MILTHFRSRGGLLHLKKNIWFKSAQLLNQGICQVVHVTPNIRSRFLSPSQPDRPTVGKRARLGCYSLGLWCFWTEICRPGPHSCWDLNFWHMAWGHSVTVLWNSCDIFYFEACAPLDCIAEMPLRNEWMCQNKWKFSCRLIRDLLVIRFFSIHNRISEVVTRHFSGRQIFDWLTSDSCSKCVEEIWRKFCPINACQWVKVMWKYTCWHL